jgi:alanine racemase
MLRPATYVAVDLDAIRHNTARVLARLSPVSRLCAVVKGNAYGHGAAAVAHACVDAGATWLAVSTVDEGVALRLAGVSAPTLVFMPPLAGEVEPCVEHGLTATATRTEHVMELRREGERQGKVAMAHIYEDLGLGRLGPRDDIMDILEAAEPWPEVQVGGIYAHFGPPGSGVNLDALDVVVSGASLTVFAAMLFEAAARITDRRLMFHAAASAMFIEQPRHHFDMVRVGTLLYGQYPGHVPARQRDLDLRDTFSLCSTIVEVREVERGTKIGYGGDYTCRGGTRVATVPVGLAHGLGVLPESVAARPSAALRSALRTLLAGRLSPSLGPVAQVDGRPAPVIGRISMDQCCLDVTGIPDADRGTPVALPARRLTTSPAIPRLYVPGQD